jgi:hypothetical protein
LKGFGKLSDFYQTGQLEVFHSMLLKYVPKRQHFNYADMPTRLQLAALDHSHNVGRQTDTNVMRQVYFKARKQWTLRNVYRVKQYYFVYDIIYKVIERRLDPAYSMTYKSSRLNLPNIKI